MKSRFESFIGNVSESLGKGRPVQPMPTASTIASRPASGKLAGVKRTLNAYEIPTERIIADPDQPRTEFDPESIERMAESLKAHGQQQPIKVRYHEAGDVYVILQGERRWRGANLAGLATMVALVDESNADSNEVFVGQVVENLLREDLPPMDQARAFKSLMDRNEWSATRLAKELCIPQPTISRALALLKIPAEVQELVESGEIPPATAYQIGQIGDPVAETALARRVVDEKLSRSETAEIAKSIRGESQAAKVANPPKGRGGRPAPPKVTSRVFNGRVKISAESDQPFSLAELRASLSKALERIDKEMGL